MIFNKGHKVVAINKGRYAFGDDIMTVCGVRQERHMGSFPQLQFEEALKDFPNHWCCSMDFNLAPEPEEPKLPPREARKRNIYEALEVMEHYDIRRVQNGEGTCGYFLGEAKQGATRFSSIEELVDHLVPDNSLAILSKQREVQALKDYIENKHSVIKDLSRKATTGSDRLGVLEIDLQAMIDAEM